MEDGKSTLAMHLNAILKPTSGAVYIDGIDTVNDELILEIRKNVGMIFQNPDNQIISSVVKEDVSFGPKNLEIPDARIDQIIDESLKMVDLSGYRDHDTNKLSGGQKQKLAISGVLAMQPECIIFDESTSMLDKKGANQVLNIIKKLNSENNITIIHITHNMEEVALANRVIVIDEGKVVLDALPSEVFKNTSFLEEIGLDIPLPARLIYELKKEGISLPNENVLTCEECVEVLSNLLKEANINVSN